MLLKRLFKDKHKAQRIAHIGAGVVILIHSYDQLETGHGHPLFFLIAGLIFVSIAIAHPFLEKKFPWIDGVFFCIEALLSLIMCYEAFHHGKKAIPIAYLAAAGMQLFAAYKNSKKGIAHHKAAQVKKSVS
jgi:hypothetical protein